MNKANLWVVGEGSGSSRPKFTCAGTIAMFDITAAGVAIDNVYFPSSTAVPTARIRTASTETIIRSCYFECGASDTASALRTVTGAGQLLVKDTTFVSTATAIASLPSVAFEVVNAITDIDMDNVTFQGGTYGWSDYAFKGGAAVTRLDAINLDLLSGSDFSLATGSSYRIHVRSQSGASKVVIAA
jgi:hypothetical protein